MADEVFFSSVLDEHPADHAARLLLADWLTERGDWRADGLRWMARMGKYPTLDASVTSSKDDTWDWWSMLPGWNGGIGDKNDRHDRLEPRLLRSLAEFHRKSNWTGDCAYCEYLTRRAAEEALCRVLMGLQRPRPLER